MDTSNYLEMSKNGKIIIKCEKNAVGIISVPKGVTEIGNGAFRGCTNLTSIELPNTVTKIGFAAFRDCSSLTSIILPNNVVKIEDGTFKNCTKLTSIVLPKGITEIGASAFAYCSSLSSILIPKSVEIIGPGAFLNCASLCSIAITYGLKIIKAEAFKGCSSLSSIDIPNSVIEIGCGAFFGCNNLVSLKIPQIGQDLFNCNNNIENKYYNIINIKHIISQKNIDGLYDYFMNLDTIEIKDTVSNLDKYFSTASTPDYCMHLETIIEELDNQNKGVDYKVESIIRNPYFDEQNISELSEEPQYTNTGKTGKNYPILEEAEDFNFSFKPHNYFMEHDPKAAEIILKIIKNIIIKNQDAIKKYIYSNPNSTKSTLEIFHFIFPFVANYLKGTPAYIIVGLLTLIIKRGVEVYLDSKKEKN